MIIASAVISTGRRRVKPACEGGLGGILARVHALARETDDQDAVGGGDAHAHDGARQRRHADRRVRQEQHPDDAGQRGRAAP